MARIKKYRSHKPIKLAAAKSKSKVSKKMVWTLILAFLMVGSVFGIVFYGFANPGQERKYGDYEFSETQGGWWTVIDNAEYIFDYHPADLERINISAAVGDRLRTSKVWYITFDPTSPDVEILELIRFNMGQIVSLPLNVYIIPGVMNESVVYAHQQIVTCANATPAMPVVVLDQTNETSVSLDGDCVHFNFERNTGVALLDRLIYSLLGVMQ